MPIHQLYKYEIPEEIKNIEDQEKKIINLLDEIKESSSCRDTLISLWGLNKILNAVNERKLIIPGRENGLNYEIDLSKAKEIIDDYIARSEKGCEYCENLEKHYKDNKPGRYCKIDETEKSIIGFPISSNESIKIREFYKTGCKDRTSTLKSLEKVLLEEGLRRQEEEI
jgi:hypothetical protein